MDEAKILVLHSSSSRPQPDRRSRQPLSQSSSCADRASARRSMLPSRLLDPCARRSRYLHRCDDKSRRCEDRPRQGCARYGVWKRCPGSGVGVSRDGPVGARHDERQTGRPSANPRPPSAPKSPRPMTTRATVAVQSASVPTVSTSPNVDCVAMIAVIIPRPRNAPQTKAAPPEREDRAEPARGCAQHRSSRDSDWSPSPPLPGPPDPVHRHVLTVKQSDSGQSA